MFSNIIIEQFGILLISETVFWLISFLLNITFLFIYSDNFFETGFLDYDDPHLIPQEFIYE